MAFIFESNVPIISAANKAAFTAPAFPIGIVAKGQPEGQQFKLSRLSNPFNFFVSIGTPITGIDAKAAVTAVSYTQLKLPTNREV